MTAPDPADAAPTIGVRLEGDEVPAKDFFDAGRCLLDLLSEVGRSVSGGKDLEWRLSGLSLGSAGLVLQPKPGAANEPDAATAISRTLSGLAEMDETARRPAHFTDKALRSARKLGRIAEPRREPIVVSGDSGSTAVRIPISGRLAAHVDRLTPSPHKATGSVEGRMETLMIRGQTAFAVYDTLSGHRVECRCDRETLDEALAHFGKRVVVSGEVHYGGDGKPKFVIVNRLRPLGDRPLPEPEEMVGLLEDDPISISEWSRYVREK